MIDGYVCAVDVGTSSARAGLFDRSGKLLGRAEHPILLNQPAAEQAEHDSDDIWSAVCAAVKAATRISGVAAAQVKGLCFDATCSLVIRGQDGAKIGISCSGEPRWDTISWFDHRAMAEADECTRTGHDLLRYIGGVMSPEMQTPKLMWLKRNKPNAWNAAAYFFDLADFLSWRATDNPARSQCTLTCKWAYLPHEGGWRRDFLEAIGLDDMLEQGALPVRAAPPGEAIGKLSETAAQELGLTSICTVAAGLIDAYAGMLGAIGNYAADSGERHLALIAGTSSCLMTFAPERQFVSSIWGPYLGAALPGLWVSEGGQSATGALLDHLIATHRLGGEVSAKGHAAVIGRISQMRNESPLLAQDLHVLPDFHGNRSPLGNPHARGAIAGLRMDGSFDGLCRLYWRTCVSIALGVRDILEHLKAHGQDFTCLHVTGGHTRNTLLMELYADATGVTVSATEPDDAMLLGSAMAAAFAAGFYSSLPQACKAMVQPENLRQPNPAKRAAYERDYLALLILRRQQAELQALADV